MKEFVLATLITALIMTSSITYAEQGDWKKQRHEHMEKELSKLPKDKQELINKSMEEAKEQNKVSYEQIKKLRKEQREIVLAPSFDKSAYLEKAKQIEAIESKIATSRSERMANIDAQLTIDERKIVVDMFSHGHKKDGHKNGDDKHDMDDMHDNM